MNGRRTRLRALEGLALFSAPLWLIAMAAGAEGDVAPVVPGLSGEHPLTERQVGELLMVELRCAACHEGISASGQGVIAAPRLEEAAWRLAPEHLLSWIADPHATQPGTKMPDVFAPYPELRQEAAEAITAYLTQRAELGFQREVVDEASRARGKTLFHAVGCVACHAPKQPALDGGETPEGGDGVVGLDHVANKYSLASLSDFLFQPLRIRPAGRMPDMGLTHREADDIASYLVAGGSAGSAPGPVD